MAKQTSPKKPIKPLKFAIGGQEVDFSRCVPMKAGDWTALKRQGVQLGPKNNLLDDPDAMVSFTLWFAQSVNDAISRDMILELPITKLIAVVRYIHEASEDPETYDPN